MNEIDATEYDAINYSRRRLDVNMPGYASAQYPDQAILREALRRERRAELAFEGQRFFDIRRLKIAEIVMTRPALGANYEDNPTTTADDDNVGNPVFIENRHLIQPATTCGQFRQTRLFLAALTRTINTNFLTLNKLSH